MYPRKKILDICWETDIIKKKSNMLKKCTKILHLTTFLVILIYIIRHK